MNKKVTILLICVISVIAIGLGLFGYFSNRIEVNPDNATGNTAGNLLNGGKFCELDGVIYFSNPYDMGRLYSMNSDCTKVKKISDDCAESINAYGKHLYYIRNNSKTTNQQSVITKGQMYAVMRYRIRNADTKALDSGYSTDLSLSGNTLVYNKTENSVDVTSTVKIDGSDKKIISDTNINNASIYDDYIYYSSNLDKHEVYTMSVDTGTTHLYLASNTYMATRVDNTLYYIDLENDYALTKIDLSTNLRSVVTTDHVVLYNVYDNVIFYQKENDTHEVVRINIDGTNRTVIYTGDVSSISCTSQYTFLQKFGTNTLYKVPTNGTWILENFYPQ